ncbi:MAG TPA: RNA polymerase sigma factor [Planctomycetota bacterium]|jgi:RNA polymerase sigma-70 factor (ECF subfamily)|nr:RNA polymerase sigma factor [Planctomycetota bacterium]
MTSPSDGQLLRSFQRGDATAFTELVNLHQAALLRHARALLGPGSLYEDVVQDVFLKLAQTPPELPSEAVGDPRLERVHLLSWLHKVTRNGCMDTMRAEKRRRRREQEVAAEESHGGGMGTVDERDTREAVEREIGKLPVEQREVLVLRLLGERSYKEIAEITGRPIGTVGWLVSIGLKALGAGLAPVLEAQPVRVTRSEATAASLRLDVIRGELS